ncbi:hypothetical protein ACFX1Q_012369 [Malus domestica]
MAELPCRREESLKKLPARHIGPIWTGTTGGVWQQTHSPPRPRYGSCSIRLARLGGDTKALPTIPFRLRGNPTFKEEQRLKNKRQRQLGFNQPKITATKI